MSVVEMRASTLAEIFDAVGKIRGGWNPELDQELWFRGQGRRAYKLIPGLYRDQIIKYKYDEFTLLTKFRHLGSVHLTRPLHDAWDWYFLAQHYRLPTRLLDWTEALLPSIYFAIYASVQPLEKIKFDEQLSTGRQAPVYGTDSPAVWMLDAGSLNKWGGEQDAIYTPDDPEVSAYCWDGIFDPDPHRKQPALPIAISPPRDNPRILAQLGVFTVHGTDTRPIDDLARNHDPDGTMKLACIHIDSANIPFLWQELELAGCGRLSMFPDLDSVAEHLKWVYQSY